ncbi:MAG: methyltransferase domain-containing protein, partial [Planctomycetes bacterium]|nr:methyltransferase domain-containing protein [Planctomycetota bacterium]
MRDQTRFLLHFLRHPLTVGAVAPSSRWLARRMVEDMRLGAARTVVELGPGTGAFTEEIERRLPAGVNLLALELDPVFAAGLRHRFPRVDVINDSAENLVEHLRARGRAHADAIFCGLPWASFPPDLQGRIMSAVHEALRPSGRFATFAYLHASWFPTA